MHSSPERDPNPPDPVESLDCTECDEPMDLDGGVWKCKRPFCDSNELDPKEEYASLECVLHSERLAHNRLKNLMRGMLKCIKNEQIHGSAAFNGMVADVGILMAKPPDYKYWMKYYLTRLRAQVQEWRDQAVVTQSKLNLADPDKQIRRYSYLGGMRGGYDDVLNLIDEKKPRDRGEELFDAIGAEQVEVETELTPGEYPKISLTIPLSEPVVVFKRVLVAQVEEWRDKAFKEAEMYMKSNERIWSAIRPDIKSAITAEINAGTEAIVAQRILDLIDEKAPEK